MPTVPVSLSVKCQSPWKYAASEVVSFFITRSCVTVALPVTGRLMLANEVSLRSLNENRPAT